MQLIVKEGEAREALMYRGAAETERLAIAEMKKTIKPLKAKYKMKKIHTSTISYPTFPKVVKKQYNEDDILIELKLQNRFAFEKFYDRLPQR